MFTPFFQTNSFSVPAVLNGMQTFLNMYILNRTRFLLSDPGRALEIDTELLRANAHGRSIPNAAVLK